MLRYRLLTYTDTHIYIYIYLLFHSPLFGLGLLIRWTFCAFIACSTNWIFVLIMHSLLTLFYICMCFLFCPIDRATNLSIVMYAAPFAFYDGNSATSTTLMMTNNDGWRMANANGNNKNNNANSSVDTRSNTCEIIIVAQLQQQQQLNETPMRQKKRKRKKRQ